MSDWRQQAPGPAQPSKGWPISSTFLALIAVDFMFLLPLLFASAIVAVIAAALLVALCGVGLALALKLFTFDHGLSLHYLTRVFWPAESLP